jgi:hypothetical protein
MHEVAAVAAVLLAGQTVCANCIATKTGLPADAVGLALAKIAKTMMVVQPQGTCAGCLKERALYTFKA